MQKYKTLVGVIKEGPFTGGLCILIPLIPKANGIDLEMYQGYWTIKAMQYEEPWAYFAKNAEVEGIYTAPIPSSAIEILGDL